MSVVAWLVGRVLMRLSGHFVAVATLGFLVIVRVVLFNADTFTRGSRTFSNVTPYTNLWWAWAWVLLVVYVVWRIKRSSYGRDMFVQRDDRLAAQAVGIRVMDPRLLAFVVGAFFSAVAGSLYAHFITSFSPTVFYFDLTFRVITMLVIGGMGSVSGSILGAIAIVGLTEALRRVEDATLLYGLSQIILAVIFIVVITVRREGFLGQREVPLDRLFLRRGRHRRARDPTSADRTADARRQSPLRARTRPPSCATGSAPPSRARSRSSMRALGDVLVEDAAERAPAHARADPVQLRDERRIGAEQQLAGRREAEQLAVDLGRLPRREQDRLAHVGVDVREHRGDVGQRADVRVARCGAARSAPRGTGRRTGTAARPDRPASGRGPGRRGPVWNWIGTPWRAASSTAMTIRWSSSGFDSMRNVPSRRPALGHDRDTRRRRHPAVDVPDVQPGAVRDRPTSSRRCHDRGGPPSAARYASRKSSNVSSLEDQPLDHRLEPEDLLDPAPAPAPAARRASTSCRRRSRCRSARS